MNKINTLRKMGVLAGMMVLAGIAGANPLSKDAQILIDRALNSPTLTVRYTGANATLVEFRLNGESIGTRTIGSTKASGETNFNLNLNDLKDGDNEVEVRLYDRTGKLVGREKTKISTDQSNKGPVYLESPKVGQQVQGPTEIKLGLARQMRNISVSFFIDNNWKSLINNPPFSYLWDTSRETNGWHEVEAWVVDEGSATLKTKKTRVLVNNPGGRTDRVGVNTEIKPTANAVNTTVEGTGTGVRVNQVKPGQLSKTLATNLDVQHSQVRVSVEGGMAGTKPVPNASGISVGQRNLTPTGTRVAKNNAKPGTMEIRISNGNVPMSVVNSVNAAAGLIPITRGARLKNIGSFSIMLNSEFVNFDVPTRIDNGVPMTPFRHLIEKAGGKVDWENMTKTVRASADGHDMMLQIGDKFAKLDSKSISLEIAPYIDRGRTIVPLSFIQEALKVDVEYDKASGHVLITSKK